ncbi:MAG: ribokinase [Candidatus Faecousia sp.]|nr:ribokinase [Candidatus Faecousia sp.]
MSQKVTVFGSAAVDLMARASHLPTAGETVCGSFFTQGPGGKGFNQCAAAHRAGADVAMVTKLGRDSLSHVTLGVMEELGMRRDYIRFHDTASTGTALIMVDEQTSQNQIVVVPGACATFTDDDLAAAAQRIRDSAYLLLQLEINQDANEKAAALAKQAGVKVIINTAPYRPMSDEFLQGVYLVTPNEVEAQEATGIEVTDLDSASRAARVFYEKGVENVLITLGARGVFVSAHGREAILPAFRVQAVDTTGAGDAFNGGLLTALAEGQDLWQAARFAGAVAALSVQKLGAALSMPSREEIDQFLRLHP